MSWNNLSMKDKASYIRMGVENGITDLDTIREVYNKFAEGGSKDNTPVDYELSTTVNVTPQQQTDRLISLGNGVYKDKISGKLLYNYDEIPTAEVTGHKKEKSINDNWQAAYTKGVPSGTMASDMETMNAVTGGILNLTSPTQVLGATGRLIKNGDIGQFGRNLILGNNGIVTDKFAQEHPYWSMAANGAFDAASMGAPKNILKFKNMKKMYSGLSPNIYDTRSLSKPFYRSEYAPFTQDRLYGTTDKGVARLYSNRYGNLNSSSPAPSYLKSLLDGRRLYKVFYSPEELNGITLEAQNHSWGGLPYTIKDNTIKAIKSGTGISTDELVEKMPSMGLDYISINDIRDGMAIKPYRFFRDSKIGRAISGTSDESKHIVDNWDNVALSNSPKMNETILGQNVPRITVPSFVPDHVVPFLMPPSKELSLFYGTKNLLDTVNKKSTGGPIKKSYKDFSTRLSKAWNNENLSKHDYDYQKYYNDDPEEAYKQLESIEHGGKGHFPDGGKSGTYKTPNHPTYPDLGSNSWLNNDRIFNISARQAVPENTDRVLDYLGLDLNYNRGATKVMYDGAYQLPSVTVTPNGNYTELVPNELGTGWMYKDRAGRFDDIDYSYLDNYLGNKKSLGGNLYGNGGSKPRYRSSSNIRKQISTWEGSTMRTNVPFDRMDTMFNQVLPAGALDKLSQSQLDGLYSFAYNVGTGRFKTRTAPTLAKYLQGNATIEDVKSTMWASGDKKYRGLANRRKKERSMLGAYVPVQEAIPMTTPLVTPLDITPVAQPIIKSNPVIQDNIETLPLAFNIESQEESDYTPGFFDYVNYINQIRQPKQRDRRIWLTI